MVRKPKWLLEIKVLLWDLDGTLYQDDPKLKSKIRRNIFRVLVRNKGWSLQKAKREFLQKYQEIGSATKTLEVLGLEGTKTFEKIFEQVAWERFLKNNKKLQQVFKKLKYRHWLISNSLKKFVDLKLKLLGLEPSFFEEVIGLYNLGIFKPDPAVFKMVLGKTYLPARYHLSIGDKEATDIIPAKKIGMKTCLVWGKSKIADISLPQVYDVVKLFT